MTLTRQLLRNDVLATLKSNIAGGVWHTSLPSKHQLADQFQISRGTLRYALRILQEDGIIQSIPGSGWERALGKETFHEVYFGSLDVPIEGCSPHAGVAPNYTIHDANK